MKCSDLQIGDYVLVKPSMTLIRVAAVHNKKVGYHAVDHKLNWVREGLLAPIPLTSEILEKNEFYWGYTSNEEEIASNTIAQLSEDDKGWVWDEGDGAVKVIFPNEADGGMVLIDGGKSLTLVFDNVLYLHELQHALRLCGIDKEIEIDK